MDEVPRLVPAVGVKKSRGNARVRRAYGLFFRFRIDASNATRKEASRRLVREKDRLARRRRFQSRRGGDGRTARLWCLGIDEIPADPELGSRDARGETQRVPSIRLEPKRGHERERTPRPHLRPRRLSRGDVRVVAEGAEVGDAQPRRVRPRGATPRASNTVESRAGRAPRSRRRGAGRGRRRRRLRRGGARADGAMTARAPARARAASTTPRDRDCGVCGATPRVLSRGLKLAPRIASFGAQQRARGDGGFEPKTTKDQGGGVRCHTASPARAYRALPTRPSRRSSCRGGSPSGSTVEATRARQSRSRRSVRSARSSTRRDDFHGHPQPKPARRWSPRLRSSPRQSARPRTPRPPPGGARASAASTPPSADAMASIAHHETANGEKPAPTLAGAREPLKGAAAAPPPRPPLPRLPSATRPRMRRRTRRAPIRAGTTRGFRPRRRMRSVVKRRPRIGPPTRRDATPTARIARPTTRTA